MRPLTRTLALCAAVALARPAAAQFAPPARFAVPVARRDFARRDSVPLAPDDHRFAVRTIAGTAGWLLGVYAGAYAGVLATGCGDDCTGGALGALAGGVLGATLAAATPAFDGRCAHGRRAGRALLGSLVGTLGGAAVV